MTRKTLYGSFLAAVLFAALCVLAPVRSQSEEKTKATDTATAEVVHGTTEAPKITGEYLIEVVRENPVTGKKEVVETQRIHNIVTLEGRRYILDAALHNNASSDAVLDNTDYVEKNDWYVKLMGVNVTPLSTHTHQSADIGGANEFQAYTGNRIAWVGVLGATASSTNSASKASFPITGSGTLYGAGLVSNSTKGSVASGDYMISYAQFSSPIVVVNLDTVNVTITISLN